MVKKRGQAALEFLVTYGWAFLLILIVIAALVYFGVTRPKDYLPNRCLFGPEIGCVAYSVSTADNTFRLKLKNNVGQTITVTTLDLNSDGATNIACTNPPKPTNWLHTKSIDLTYTDCNFAAIGFTSGETVKLFLNVSFYPIKGGSNYVSNVQGEIITKVS